MLGYVIFILVVLNVLLGLAIYRLHYVNKQLIEIENKLNSGQDNSVEH